MHSHDFDDTPRIGRRGLLAGVGAAAVAGSVGALGLPGTAEASNSRRPGHRHVNPIPSPILVQTPSGLPPEHPLATIHWLLPGPEGSATPVIGLPGGGLDVEPSLITNYRGFTAFAVVAGHAKGSDGKTYTCEFDVRVMDGTYLAEDGSHHHGTFGFF